MDKLLTAGKNVREQQTDNIKVLPGKSSPLGATVYPDGVNFCIFSQNASAIELLLFDTANAARPAQTIKLDPSLNKTCYYWHVFVLGIKTGQIYAYRAYGQFAPEKGYRFDDTKVLLDPYARAIVNTEQYDRISASHPGDNCARALKGVVVDISTYDWDGDRHPRIPYSTSVIYELHVGGFTRHPNSGVSESKRGTGDEVRRTQLGNNNAYCQDNNLSWFNWNLVNKHHDLLRFVKKLIHFIQRLDIFRQEKFLEVTHSSSEPHLIWHGQYLGQPDWSENSHSLAFSLNNPANLEHLYVILNAYWEPLNFELPPLEPGNYWHRILDTALPTPDDFSDLETAVKIERDIYLATARSSVVLMEKTIV